MLQPVCRAGRVAGAGCALSDAAHALGKIEGCSGPFADGQRHQPAAGGGGLRPHAGCAGKVLSTLLTINRPGGICITFLAAVATVIRASAR